MLQGTALEKRWETDAERSAKTGKRPLFGAAVADSEHRILGFTPGFAGLTGCGEEKLKGREWSPLLFSDSRLRERALEELAERGECSARVWLEGKGGSFCLSFLAKRCDAVGKSFYLLALQDLTGWERLRQEAEGLRRSLGRISGLLDSFYSLAESDEGGRGSLVVRSEQGSLLFPGAPEELGGVPRHLLEERARRRAPPRPRQGRRASGCGGDPSGAAD